jgi:hypothetical protein
VGDEDKKALLRISRQAGCGIILGYGSMFIFIGVIAYLILPILDAIQSFHWDRLLSYDPFNFVLILIFFGLIFLSMMVYSEIDDRIMKKFNGITARIAPE